VKGKTRSNLKIDTETRRRVSEKKGGELGELRELRELRKLRKLRKLREKRELIMFGHKAQEIPPKISFTPRRRTGRGEREIFILTL